MKQLTACLEELFYCCEESLLSDRFEFKSKLSLSGHFEIDDALAGENFFRYPGVLKILDEALFNACYASARLRSDPEGAAHKRGAALGKAVDAFAGYRERLLRHLSARIGQEEAFRIEPRLWLKPCERLRIAMNTFVGAYTKEALRRAYRAVDFLLTSRAPDLQLHLGPCNREQMIFVRALSKYACENARKNGKDIHIILTFSELPNFAQNLPYFQEAPFLLVFNPRVSLAELEPLVNSSVKYRIRCAYDGRGSLLAAVKKTVKAGHSTIQAIYQVLPSWSLSETTQLLEEYGQVSKYAERSGAVFINARGMVREPSLLNEEITMDSEGNMFAEHRIGGRFIFERAKSKRTDSIDAFQRTPFEILHHIVSNGDASSALAALEVGAAIKKWLKKSGKYNGRCI